jgi:uracil permease
VFVFTLALAVIGQVVFKGFASAVAILIAIVAGYVLAMVMGMVDFTAVTQARIFEMPAFMTPKFDITAIIIIVPASLTVISEHISHQIVTSQIVGRDLLRDPGLHRSLLSDGISTMLSGCCGSVPTTTYGENIGVMAVTKVYSVWVIGGAAVIAVLLSFIQKFGAIIQTIPGPVMGGISMLLYGLIASSGLRTIVESGVDYKDKRNLTISSVIMVIGIGGGLLEFSVGQDFKFSLGGVALATLIGIILNLIIPNTKKED